MIRPAAEKVLFINSPGRVAAISTLMKPLGAPYCMGALKKAGIRSEFMNLATVDSIRESTPPECVRKLKNLYKSFKEIGEKANERRPNQFLDLIDNIRMLPIMAQLKPIEQELAEAQRQFTIRKTKEIISKIKNEGFDMVCETVWNGDGFEGSAIRTKMIKDALPDIPVYLGGPQVQFFRERILKHIPADAAAIGDGETIVVELASGRKELKNINGIVYRDDSGNIVGTPLKWEADMPNLPMPDYSNETDKGLFGGIQIYVVEDIRGCGEKCVFCVNRVVCGGTARPKGYMRTADEIEYIVKQTGSHKIRFGGAASTYSHLVATLRELKRRGIDIDATSFARIADFARLTLDQLKELRQLGLVSVFYGMEAGDDEQLKTIRKNLKVSLTEEVIKRTKEAGIMVAGSIIYPDSFDEPDAEQKFLELIRNARPDSVLLQFLGVYPGTEVADDPEKYGIEIVYPKAWDNFLVMLGKKKKPHYYDNDIQDYLIKYKIKTHFPPIFWDSLPWKINGMSFKKYSSKTMNLFKQIRRSGTTMKLTDEEILMAKCAGIPLTKFYDMCFEAEFTCDWEKFENIVHLINQGVSKKIS